MNKDTLFTIAKRTGFSVSTVSRVLSGKGRQYRISKSSIALITDEAKKCNYTPNLIAKGLRTSKTNTIGFTIPSIDNPFFSTLSGYIIRRLKSAGYNILLSDSMEMMANEKEALLSFISRKVDGIIAVPVGDSPKLLEQIGKSVPVVLIDRYFDNTVLPYVCTDNYWGAREATEYLIRKGYKNILAIQGVQTSMPNKERVKGFLDAVASNDALGIKGRVVGNAFSVENGIEQTEAVIRSCDMPDAIFPFSSTILLGVIKTLRKHGVSVPDDVALISFDDNIFLDYMNPPVSRVAQNVEQIGRTAADMMLDMLSMRDSMPDSGNPPQASKQLLIKPDLIIRESC